MSKRADQIHLAGKNFSKNPNYLIYIIIFLSAY